ncbi:MAG TPA: GspE/PulE family protein [Pirellulales bacterium]|nr:GspE/PulE family protein [Pirellulales bacterium]
MAGKEEAVEFEEVTGTDELAQLQLNGVAPDLAVAALVDHAVRSGASDLFLRSEEQSVEASMRHLGIVRSIASLPTDLGNRCMLHIRAAAGLKFDERRKPQDGRWVRTRPDGQTVDLRLSTMPTLYGESLAMRILVRDAHLTKLEALGLIGAQLGTLLSWLHSPSGLILVSGPTGSGKTTTLYACLHYLNDGRRKIHTIEDPIEYSVDGIVQSQVDDINGPDFKQLLRAVLRQGPDVVMVGELRDAQAAETAVRAANSGQLVFATLHAPVAVGAIQSLLGLGIHPHFVSSSLLGVISQRLVRTLSSYNRMPLDLAHAPQTFEEVRQWLEPNIEPKAYAAVRGADGEEIYVGRTAVFELLSLTPSLRQMIADGRPFGELAEKALEGGMIDFRRASLLKVAQGVTTFDEVLRVIPTAEQWVGW